MDILQLIDLAEKHKYPYKIRRFEKDLHLIRNDEKKIGSFGQFWNDFSSLFFVFDIDYTEVQVTLGATDTETQLWGMLTNKIVYTKDGPCICFAYCETFPVSGRFLFKDALNESCVLQMFWKKFFSKHDYVMTSVPSEYIKKYKPFHKGNGQTVVGLLLPILNIIRLVFSDVAGEDDFMY